ncbi:hypothetical protein CLU85_3113 [Acidovorax sp. 69]|uniref:hypothetical protein n=1 Tax=Acidovorax sp. 69 TaxID=2035202 RepID=UPI000C2354FB|nr:hypothetical protein [Acidovorax sp. 69]PJI98294.1 hypothetical protein CLU85_3113 [Acidovorax sp. 69]
MKHSQLNETDFDFPYLEDEVKNPIKLLEKTTSSNAEPKFDELGWPFLCVSRRAQFAASIKTSCESSQAWRQWRADFQRKWRCRVWLVHDGSTGYAPITTSLLIAPQVDSRHLPFQQATFLVELPGVLDVGGVIASLHERQDRLTKIGRMFRLTYPGGIVQCGEQAMALGELFSQWSGHLRDQTGVMLLKCYVLEDAAYWAYRSGEGTLVNTPLECYLRPAIKEIRRQRRSLRASRIRQLGPTIAFAKSATNRKTWTASLGTLPISGEWRYDMIEGRTGVHLTGQFTIYVAPISTSQPMEDWCSWTYRYPVRLSAEELGVAQSMLDCFASLGTPLARFVTSTIPMVQLPSNIFTSGYLVRRALPRRRKAKKK